MSEVAAADLLIRSNPGELWTEHMRRGEFEAAWRISDRVMRAPVSERDWSLPRHMQPVWTGAPLRNQRVLVRCYHGLGDTIQFIRYAPLLQAIAREVIVWAQPELLPLLKHARHRPADPAPRGRATGGV